MHLIFSFGLDGILFALIKPYAWTSITNTSGLRVGNRLPKQSNEGGGVLSYSLT